MHYEVRENTNVSIQELGEKSKFRDLLKPLPPDRDAKLAESIQVVSVNIPVVAWHDGEDWWLVDGHHRRKHWLNAFADNRSLTEPAVYELKAKTEEEVCQWIRATHLNRRNMTEEEQTYQIGQLYNGSKKPEGRPSKTPENKAVLPEKKRGQTDHVSENGPKRTAETIAEQHGVSPKTVIRAGDFAKGVDQLPPEEKEKVLAGESDMTKAEVEALGRGKKSKANGKHEAEPTPEQKIKELCQPFTALVRKQGEIIAEFERMAQRPGGELIDSLAIDEMKTKGRNVQEVIKARRPTLHKPCEGKGCKTCQNRGYMRG